VGVPKEILPPYVPLYPPLSTPSVPSPPPLEVEAASVREPPPFKYAYKLRPRSPWVCNNPTLLGPMNLMLILSPQVLSSQLPVKLACTFNQEHFNSPNAGLASPHTPGTHCPADDPERSPGHYILWPAWWDTGGRWTFVYQPFTTTDLLNWKHLTPPSWKSLRLWLI
jgi:hypothetical protein